MKTTEIKFPQQSHYLGELIECLLEIYDSVSIESNDEKTVKIILCEKES